jgi:5-methylcytosine-specific restriction endonuclease McrA
MFFREDDVMEVDHRIPKSKGGKDSYDNWQLLHRHCHDTKTALDGSLGTPNLAAIVPSLSPPKDLKKSRING